MKNHTLLFLLLCAFAKLAAQVPSERLFATTYYYSAAGAFVPSDSNHIHYISDSVRGGGEQFNWQHFWQDYDTGYYQHYANIAWQNKNRYVNSPDGHGNSNRYDRQNWNGNNYFASYREAYTFDASYNLTEMTIQNYDTTHGIWDTAYINEYTYDSGNRLLSMSHRFWPYANTGGDYEDTYTYDASDNMLTKNAHYYYNGWIDAWVQTYTYDASNNNLTYSYQSWDTATQVWTYADRKLHSYDASHNDTLTIDQNWVSSQWQNSRHTTHTYDSHHNVLTGTIQNWVTATGSWRNNYTYTRIFDVNLNCTSQLTQNWDTIASHYFDANRHSFTFNTANKLTTDLYELYDTAASAWIHSTKNDKTYTPFNNVSQDVYYTWTNSAWAPDRSYGYYWETYTTPTGILEKTYHTAAVYPDPMSNSVTISFDATVNQPAILLISNMQGQIVDTKTVMVQNGSNNIAYTNPVLPAGMYQGQIRTSNDAIVFRLLKN
ncbi:MAG: hypothetical protein JWO03_1034 [Bacteroidetes bacterium]|nr:hypothetical protein [Bacteroidota bacterium]